jgi:hypothetical protein
VLSDCYHLVISQSISAGSGEGVASPKASNMASSSAELQQNHWLEPDVFATDNDADIDSALGDEMSMISSTASLMSSLMRACEENGRTYHGYKDGKYLLPNDTVRMMHHGEEKCMETDDAAASNRSR